MSGIIGIDRDGEHVSDPAREFILASHECGVRAIDRGPSTIHENVDAVLPITIGPRAGDRTGWHV